MKKNFEHLEDSGVDERIILRWIYRKWDVGGWAWTGSIWFMIEQVKAVMNLRVQ